MDTAEAVNPKSQRSVTTDYTDGTDIGIQFFHIRVIREIRGSAAFGI